MRLAALFSGGKDSTYAIHEAVKQGHEIKYLITIFPKADDSWMFHHPCIELTKLQAESIGIKQIWKESSGEKERELLDLTEAIGRVRKDIDGILSGAIASEYQRSRIDSICKQFGLVDVAPLWGKDSANLLKEEVDAGLDVMIVAVASSGLDESWLGKRLDKSSVEKLIDMKMKFGLNPVFEGGEAETFVLDCPLFKKKIVIENFEKKWDSKTGSGSIEVKSAKLEAK